jgi:hypothetical protein
MTGKEFRKALKEKFKQLGIDDEEINVTAIGSFLRVYEGNLSKQIDDIYALGGDIDDILKLHATKYYDFCLSDSDDAESMYVEITKKI